MGPLTRQRGPRLAEDDGHLDLVPLIDCVFLILLFFMLCGRITVERSANQVTVPPTVTATKQVIPVGWATHTINVTSSRHGGRIQWNSEAPWSGIGAGAADGVPIDAYRRLRAKLDAVYDAVAKDPDARGTGLLLPRIDLIVRADADADMRTVQEVIQVCSDSVSVQPDAAGEVMRPKAVAKPFVHITYATRNAGEP
jgi:hypothetical protein